MTPELWQRLKPLFLEAMERPAGERTNYVMHACGDDFTLRTELMTLIRASDDETGETEVPLLDLHGLTPTYGKYSIGELILGRFEIVRCLGSGGMGDVYEAMDRELLQRIALKTIRPDIARDAAVLARFKKEVQLARRVSGAHVCRIHELFVVPPTATTQGSCFLTMEFLEGITLAEKIHLSGPIAWREAQQIATAICAGLSAIHEAGVIHRDLKTRNIMMTPRGARECAVVMDFGLARELEPTKLDNQAGMTRPGAVLGTPEYMAPEQFEGAEVTRATDVYALGVVLYELVTGKQPFAASTPFAAAVRRGRRPQAASTLQPGLPRRWDATISKCLEYQPGQRYQSAGEVAQALSRKTPDFASFPRKWSKSVAAGISPLLLPFLLLIPAMRERVQGMLYANPQKHIAVLPFVSTGGNAENQALADGLMDALSGRLSNLSSPNQSLWVVPTSEIRDHEVSSPSSARRKCGATIVVQGTMAQNNNTLHVNLAVIDTTKPRQIGALELEAKTGDLATLENDAVVGIARLIDVPAGDAGGEGKRQSASPAAYENYLKALGYLQRYDKTGNLDLAISELRAAIKTDPKFALAYASLGESYRLKYKLDQDPDWLKTADANARKAAELDAQSPAVYVTLAKIHQSSGHNELALQELRHALELNPRDADAVSGLAHAYDTAGRANEAEASYKRAINLRPDYWDGYEDLGTFYDRHGKSVEAIGQYERAIQLSPDNAQLYLNLGGAYINSGDSKLMAKAEITLKKAISLDPTYAAYANLAYLYSIQGQRANAVAAAEKAVQLKQSDYVAWAILADAYEWMGAKDKVTWARAKMVPLVLQAIELNPQDAEAQSTLAVLYADQNLRAKAIPRIQAAIAISQQDPVVLSNIACAYELLGDRRAAIEYIQRALKKGYTLSDLKGDPSLQALSGDPRLTVSPVSPK